jgi:multiple sugar transport system permease protein
VAIATRQTQPQPPLSKSGAGSRLPTARSAPWAGSRHSSLRRELPRLAAITPAAVLLSLFFVGPALWAVYASLTDRTLIGIGAQDTSFIGLDNYRRLWDDPDFIKILRNTMMFVVGSAVIGQTGLGLLLALLINQARGSRLAGLAYAAVLVAWISPPTFAGSIWGSIVDPKHGTLNQVLSAFGLPKVAMLDNHAMLLVVIADVWRGTAFAMIIFLGALQTIPPQIYEAARVDGANAWRRFRDHTLPMIGHLCAIVLMTTTITTMGSFLLIVILTNGEPGKGTETIALYAFHRAFSTYLIGYGAAISVVMLGLNLLFAAAYLRIARVSE